MLNAKVYLPSSLENELLAQMHPCRAEISQEISRSLSALPLLTTLVAYYTVPVEVNPDSIILNGKSAVLSRYSLPEEIISRGYVTVYAATIEPNSLKQTQPTGDPFTDYIYGTLNAYILEDTVNSLQATLEELSGAKLHRVSPGYGNFTLETQKDIIKLLEKKGLPISLDSEHCELKPLYSTTGVIGPLERAY